MKRRWIRNQPRGSDSASALAVALGAAAGVALVIFYFARLFLAREELEPLEVARKTGSRPLSASREDGGSVPLERR